MHIPFSHTKLASGWVLIRANFDPIQNWSKRRGWALFLETTVILECGNFLGVCMQGLENLTPSIRSVFRYYIFDISIVIPTGDTQVRTTFMMCICCVVSNLLVHAVVLDVCT